MQKEFYKQVRDYGVRAALSNVFFCFAKWVLRAKRLTAVYK